MSRDTKSHGVFALTTCRLSPVVAYVLLVISLYVCISSGAAGFKRIGSMIEGITAYTWNIADGVRQKGGFTYSFTPLGESQSVKSSRYDVFMRNRGSKKFAVMALEYAHRSALNSKPIKVYVNPINPVRSVLVPGISPITAVQLLAIFAALIPSFLIIRLLIGVLWWKQVPKDALIKIIAPILFYLFSFVAALLYMSTYSYVLRTMPPALPMTVWGIGIAILFLLPCLEMVQPYWKLCPRFVKCSSSSNYDNVIPYCNCLKSLKYLQIFD